MGAEATPKIQPPIRGPRAPWWRGVARSVGGWVVAGVIAVGGFFAVQGLRPAPEVQTEAGLAPDFALRTIDGELVRLSELRGRPVVLNFWATWCGPCRVELPSFARFARAHPEVVVLGIAVDSGTAAELRVARKRLDIPYPVLLSEPGVARDYGVTVLPTTVVLDADGRVVRSQAGLMFGWQLAAAVAAP